MVSRVSSELGHDERFAVNLTGADTRREMTRGNIMTHLYAMVLLTMGLLRERVPALRRQAERGAGGNTLEILLLAVGGVIVAGIVVVAVKASIDSRTSQLNP